jgi:ElaB/YqjD/DUF883 family membrane-anchored ribosome-binding protein
MTHLIYMTFTAGILFNFGSFAEAATLEEVEAGLTRAHNQYFEALLKGGSKTQAEADSLREKIISPAIKELKQVVEESNQKYAERYVRVVAEEEFKKGLKKAEREQETYKINDDPRVPPAYLKGVVNEAFSPLNDPPKEPKVTETQKPLLKNEPVIDGKNVPEEIEFPGKKRPSPRPSSQPSVSR